MVRADYYQVLIPNEKIKKGFNMDKVIVVIPARYGGKRFPGKPLCMVKGKPMIQRVWEKACEIPGVDRVLVATDHLDIAKVIENVGGVALVTNSEYESGSDRVADIVRVLGPDRIILNVQGDLPFFNPGVGSTLIHALNDNPLADIATPVQTMHNRLDELIDHNVVKVVFDLNFRALYFGRSPLPSISEGDHAWYKHIGVYAYRNRSLQQLAELPCTGLEHAERLEQLRALEHGMYIKVCPVVDDCGQEINTPEDLRKANHGC